MSLDNETGLDPPGIRVRPVTGLVAADYFAPGYFVWAVLIANLARIGYEEKTMYMAAYDWRISFQNTEVAFVLYSHSADHHFFILVHEFFLPSFFCFVVTTVPCLLLSVYVQHLYFFML